MNSLNSELLSVQCAHIHRDFKNGSRGSLDSKPVGNGEVGVKPCHVRILVFVGKIQLFSNCLQFHFPYNLAKQSINRRSAKEQKSKFIIN